MCLLTIGWFALVFQRSSGFANGNWNHNSIQGHGSLSSSNVDKLITLKEKLVNLKQCMKNIYDPVLVENPTNRISDFFYYCICFICKLGTELKKKNISS